MNLPESWLDKRVLLHFGAVDYEARVWLNGKDVGSHRGGYTPFALEITDLLQADENVISVYVEDDTRSSLQASGKQCPDFYSRGCHYTRTTGIWQTVWMEAVPQTYIASVELTPDLDGGWVYIKAKMDGNTKGMTLKAEAFMDGSSVGSAQAQCFGETAIAVITLSEVRAWSPEDPFLYDLKLSLEDSNGIIDQVDSYFGVRSIRIDPPAVLLNGKPVF